MIFEYKQIDTNPNVQQVIYRGQVVGTGSSIKHFLGTISIRDIEYTISTNSDGKILIKKEDYTVGEIEQKVKHLNLRKWFDPTISYYDFRIEGRTFTVYHIGFDKKDHNFFKLKKKI